ncbi:hypothetical protein CKO11_17000 [Rhodobacter sp. TJ_12]|uniref:hypothetical protein n=1 Tax=Rhodobacter sp. TJ_12 TaxID=2029399 RepID=UPI001CBEC2F7|nr:hypothetical protein [Rhodobacter sp. TJ_12]MBZ4024146.1 hypothetical protein [Rhodobacter sp. TJ_12]
MNSETSPIPFLSITPYAGQSEPEIAAWFRCKYPNGQTDKATRAYAVELYKTKPSVGQDEWYSSLTDYQRSILDAAKQAKAVEKDEKKRIKFRDEYGLSDEESRELWALRGMPSFDGERSEWDRARDKLRKRKKAGPRKNADLSTMTPAEREEHRRKQMREAQQRLRANKKAEREAAARGESAPTPEELTEDELERKILESNPNYGIF